MFPLGGFAWIGIPGAASEPGMAGGGRTYPGAMTQAHERSGAVLSPTVVLHELNEERLAELTPAKRYQLHERLEKLFSKCAEELEAAEPGRGDARWADLMVRIVDREAKLFRLD